MTDSKLCKLNILLIDEAAELAEVLAEASDQQNYCIRTVQSREGALATLANTSIDVLIVDIAEKGNAALICQARELHPDLSILIIFEAADMNALLDVLCLGSISFLQKPIKLTGLKRYLAKAAEKNSLQWRLQQSFHELQIEKEFLAVALRSIGDGVITTDPEGRITMLNGMAEKLTGWLTKDAKGLPVNEVFNIVDVSSHEKVTSPIEIALVTGETAYLSNHTTLLAKNGQEYQIIDSAALIRNEQDNILGTILVFSDVSEQYRLRQEARAEQDKIQILFDGMQTMAGIVSAEGVLEFANTGALQAVGFELEDVVGQPVWQTPWFNYDEDLMEAIHEYYRQACAGISVPHDIQIYTPMGLLWIEFSLHAVLAEDGSIRNLLAEGRDVSNRKKIEDENYSALQHLKLYREQTPLAAVEWDVDLLVVDWNEAAERMFGYSLEEVRGQNLAEIMLPTEDKQVGLEVWRQLMAETGGRFVEMRAMTKSGRSLLVEWHSSALCDDTGAVLGGISLAIDITQEHHAQQALERQAKEQQDILNTLIDGVIMFGVDARMLSYNNGAETLFGYSAEEAQGMELMLLRTESDRHRIKCYIDALSQGEPKVGLADTMEVVGQRKGERTFPMLLTVVELPVLDDGTRRFIAVCKDLTEMKSQQAKLQRAMKMDALGKLVGGIAHDYNNMLGVILGYAELIRIKFSAVEGLSKYIENISEAGERGHSLTKRMLAFSKQESTEAKAVDVNQILAKQREFFEKSVTVAIQIEYYLDDSPWQVWIDPSELEDALLNLAINAKHAMPDGGRLTFTSRVIRLSKTDASAIGLSANDYVTLSVTDTGSGIDQELLNKIFDPFFSTKGVGGTGLGLSQVYGCMERAGGTVRVYSQKGIGTELVLYFPRYQSAIDRTSVKPELSHFAHGHGERVLVVDDEPALRELANEILTLEGYQVLTANDGQHALEMLKANQIDVLLSDVIMPIMDGYQLAKRVSELYPEVKIQLASGFSDNRHVSVSQKQWHEQMLHKPYSSSELLKRMASLLNDETGVP